MGEYFVIEGGVPLKGTIYPGGNKNAALPAMAAALLTEDPVTLRNMPDIQDVETMGRLLEVLGVDVQRIDAHTWQLQAAETRGLESLTASASNVVHDQASASGLGSTSGFDSVSGLFRSIRGSILVAGPLLTRLGHFLIPAPGGDVIGRRRVDTHFLAFQALGAAVEVVDGFFRVHSASSTDGGGLTGTDILLDEVSVTGTENAIMAAVLAKGTTIIRNAASEPHVQDLCQMLNAMGAQIAGAGTNTLVIQGVDRLHGTDFKIGSDHIEVGSYIALAAATGGELLIHDAAPHHLRMVRSVFRRLGVEIEIQDGLDGDSGAVFVPAGQSLRIVSDMGGAIPSIADAPWPAFPADLMSIALVLATQCEGVMIFHEKLFESRLFFVDKLIPMGARIVLCDPHRALVYGPSRLHGDEMESPDIRAGMAMLIAALAAEGTSVIRNIRQIDRGYEIIEEKLKPLGARISRMSV